LNGFGEVTPVPDDEKNECVMSLVLGAESAGLALATALGGTGWLAFAVIGCAVGWAAGWILGTGDLILFDVFSGVCGALLGGLLLGSAFDATGWQFTCITAILGAFVPIWLLWRRRHW
jgi:uncharacterized membrane protein YeaQ/YmgE (transglycosylase-associated protein family)